MNPRIRRTVLKRGGSRASAAFALPRLATALQETTSPQQRLQLKITDIRTSDLQSVQVRIYTDQVLTGDGGAVYAVSGAASIVNGLRLFLLKQSPLNMKAFIGGVFTDGAAFNAGVKYIYIVSPGTAGEWQTWRRDMSDFAPGLFRQDAWGKRT
jgi:hypothetical protein